MAQFEDLAQFTSLLRGHHTILTSLPSHQPEKGRFAQLLDHNFHQMTVGGTISLEQKVNLE